ncbi:hypothetical protein, partial [Salmonella enterica]|uniref:hypothetical protein n=1 Tax=Salmonella enterica TaxID=28901 RepID=UPI003524818E
VGATSSAADPDEAAAALAPVEAHLQFDLLPPLRLASEAVRRLPPSVFLSAALRALTLRDPRPVFAAAFADECLFGLRRMYSAVLAESGPSIGRVMRALSRPEALPALLH